MTCYIARYKACYVTHMMHNILCNMLCYMICNMLYSMLYTMLYYMICNMLTFMCCQAGHLPPLNADDASMFSTSERITQDHLRKYKTKAAELKDLIQEVLHHPDFDVREVDSSNLIPTCTSA
jgi:hypothetical protein